MHMLSDHPRSCLLLTWSCCTPNLSQAFRKASPPPPPVSYIKAQAIFPPCPFSHQMYVRYKISQNGCCNPKGPNPVSLYPEDPQAEILPHLRRALLPPAAAVQFRLLYIVRVRGRREYRTERQREEYLDEHKDTEDLESMS